MDLMNDYDLIAPFYDIEHAQFDEDLELYRSFAELCTGPLLELACGSGRLLIPLAREGYTLTGVDTSEKMLSLASPLELYAEEIDRRTGRHLGNFPQAFTHLALINAVMHVIRADQEEAARQSPWGDWR